MTTLPCHTKYPIVRKSNDMILKSRFELTVQQQKLLLYIISSIEPGDDDMKYYEFSIREFCRVCGIDENSGTHYADLKRQLQELLSVVWFARLDAGSDTETSLRWLDKVRISKRCGSILVRLDSDLKPFLLHLKSHYTEYELDWVLKFRSKYSIRLYEYIKAIHYDELHPYSAEIPIENLKRVMGACGYERWPDFRTRALEPSIREISEKSDKILSYEITKKNGKRVEAVSITIETAGVQERLTRFRA